MLSRIHDCAAAGNIPGVSAELDRGASIEQVDSERNGTTPLLAAISSKAASSEMIDFLVGRGARLDRAYGEYGALPMQAAIRSGDVAKIDCLLKHGADINYVSSSGYDALLTAQYTDAPATNEKTIPLLRHLLARGASQFSVSKYLESAMRVASRNGRFDIIRLLLDAGAPFEQLGWNPLFTAIGLGTVEDVRREAAARPDLLETRDWWERTPWLMSLQTGDIDKASDLLEAGADQSAQGRCGRRHLMYAVANHHADMIRWLLSLGMAADDRDEFGNTALLVAAEEDAVECVRVLLEAGADPFLENHIPENAMKRAVSPRVVRLLLQYGCILGDMSDETRRLYLGFNDDTPGVSRDQFMAGRKRCFGKANPEVMEIAFWHDMVRTGISGWRAGDVFDVSTGFKETPIWCYQRFGRSITPLPDGRIIEIAGEHEDYYDPDFCIYNDVVVHEGEGTGSFQIYGYPKSVFQPTDFHSATRVDDYIYIIGNLGYQGTREPGTTPVYRLNCTSMAIERVETSGAMPGWIYKHEAAYDALTHSILIGGGTIVSMVSDRETHQDNSVSFRLDLDSLRWSRSDA